MTVGSATAAGESVDVITDALLTASRLLVAISARSIAQVDETITITQFRTLVILSNRGPVNLATLAGLLDVQPSTTLDLGCGPRRFTASLQQRGFPALGVDTSRAAVELTRQRGGTAIHADLFAPLPAEGCWEQILLADGNIASGVTRCEHWDGLPTCLLPAAWSSPRSIPDDHGLSRTAAPGNRTSCRAVVSLVARQRCCAGRHRCRSPISGHQHRRYPGPRNRCSARSKRWQETLIANEIGIRRSFTAVKHRSALAGGAVCDPLSCTL